MHNTMLLLLFVLFVDGVSGADTDQMSVIEGDSVTLHTDLTEVLNDHTILWKFGSKGSFLSQITRNKNFTSFSVTDDVVFRGRLQVDPNTGSLTIRNTRIRHSGQYQLTIFRGRSTSKIFHVTVQHVVSGTDGVKSTQESVTEGDSVTLNPDLTRIERDDLMLWMFGDNSILLAKLDVETKEISLNDAEQRFRDRLQLSQTGSLTIRNTRTTDAGLYQLQIRGRESLQQFILTVNQPGLSPGAVVGIVVAVVAVAVAAGVIYYRRKISELRKQMLPVPVSVSVPVTVTEGEDVTLKPDKNLNKDDLIQWQFGDKNLWTPIAEIRGEPREIFTYDDNVDGRFKGRLELDKTTGSLIIRNTRATHSGPYTLQIMSSSGASQQIFIITVNEKVEVKSVQYGDPVTLKPGTEIQRDDRMLWMFGDQDDLIAQVKAGTGEIYDGAGEIFRGRLKLDEKTGSLTITNISTEHIGLYKLQTITSSRGILCKKFRVSMQMRAVQVTAGEPVHLDTGLHKIQRDDEIQWILEDENSLIAEIKGGTGVTCDVPDGIFKDRLKLNKTTGSLTINNSTAKHAGRYKLKICNSKGDIYRTYIVFIDSSEKRENESDVETALLGK